MRPKLLLLFCMAAVFAPGLHCKTKVSDDTQRARLPEFLTELDLASLEASEEDVESLKKIVKRLAPAKNGEYLMYQGVMGQPGVDFPVLTTIPATKFSCRGLKGGYYADLETNCQVFHICDNGRKISFLCPNGTIFQQSQLICDWWFKVDCGKSADLYEQSAEQLAEEERKRAEAKRMNSEFHRASGAGSSGQVYYQSQNQNLDYDGRQNGRTNPFGQTSTNGVQKSVENNQQQNGRNGNQLGQSQSTPQPSKTGQYNNQQQQSLRQNFNNLNNGKQQESGNQNLNSGGEEHKTNYRSPKGFSDFRNGFKEQLTTAASPFKEYQQPAESAAFATSRNNRYNKSYQYNQFGGNYYSSSSSSSLNKFNDDNSNVQNSFGAVIKHSQTPHAFTPIYKPRNVLTTTSENPNQVSVGRETTTQRAYVNTDIYRQNTVTKSSEFGETVTTPDYRDNFSTVSNSYPESFTQYPSTQKPYVNTDTYRHGGALTEATNAWTNYDQTIRTTTTTTTIPPKEAENLSSYSTLTTDNYEGNTVTGSSNAYYYNEENTFSSSTQRPYGDENGYQEIVVTSRNLSPYDTSFTYKNGKISSTLGPYIPFTKNYAYTTTSTTTTNKPPVYTATVPTIPDNRKPVVTTATPWFFQTENPKVSVRPLAEREHAIEMLHSLQELETTPATPKNGSRVGLNIPPSSGPATLHTLALYFATASENFDSNETATDTAVRIGTDDERGEEKIEISTTTQSTASVELPTNLLTQHTVKSYTDLFNKNSATNVSTVTRLGEDGEDYSSYSKEDIDNDLDLEQSQGPVSGTNKRGNNPKLRELAQVFTHALSAYLQDPDTFRKVLTEIRPTEPPLTTEIENIESTTPYPTTLDDYPSATKEKDEVLDFSDVTKATRRKKLTTPYPVNSETVTTPSESTFQTYYTTQEIASSTPGDFDESLNEAQSSDFRSSSSSSSSSSGNDFAQEVNHVLRDNGGSNDVTGPSGNEDDSYFPVGPVFTGNRFGGFQNNSANTYQPYGKGVGPTDATPIGDNYSPESTPASYEISYSDFGDYGSLENSVRSKTTTEEVPRFTSEEASTTTAVTLPQENTIPPSTKTPFIINYFETPTKAPRYVDESLMTSGTAYSGFGDQGNDLSSKEIDEKTTTDYPETLTTQSGDNYSPLSTHWTASPTVTRLWETTVFLDPNRINQGLTGPGEDAKIEDSVSTTPVPRTTETSTWKFTPNENDAPTAFTLLPTVYGSEKTETPAPTFTTHSSIVTTITSSSSISSRDNFTGYNITENEIVKAQEIFGGLNATSSSTLMRVMNQADRNSTVRQLVLLLISHCKGPMNKTMEEEKEQLLNALLRMPVNEFSTEESREIVAGLNNLQLPIGNQVQRATPTPASVTTAATVTTYRSRRGRKFRTSTDAPKTRGKSSNDGLQTAGSANAISIDAAASPSDNRALELLKSLYTIAAKWG